LAYRLSSRINFTLEYALNNQASALANTNYLHSEALHLQGNYQLSPRLSLAAGVNAVHDRYRGGVPMPLKLSDSRQLSETLGGSMKIGRKITLNLQGTHVNRKADITLYNFRSDNVTLGLTAQF
jgi:hypothetical protein